MVQLILSLISGKPPEEPPPPSPPPPDTPPPPSGTNLILLPNNALGARCLDGSSAGGQAVVHLCDTIAAAVPSADARCVVDSGFFVDSEDRSGNFYFRSLAQKMVALHQPNFGDCAQAYSSTYRWRCFFPQYTISRTVSTPLFIFNTLFDNIALTIGKQLPSEKAYVSQCLGEILNRSGNITNIVRTRSWAGLQWSTNYCTSAEREAIFESASMVYKETLAFDDAKPSAKVFLPASSIHCAIFGASNWNKGMIGGVSFNEVLQDWLGV
ncbi:unnamed protein product [Closterium sp. NIES-53]